MKANWYLAFAAAVAIATAAPAQLTAQGASGRGQSEQRARQQEQQSRAEARDRLRAQRANERIDTRVIEERRRAEQRDQRRNDRDRYDERDVWQQQGRNGGPAFCRSGAGHPVHGRQWCVDKGFGLGNGRNARGGIDLGDIIFGQPRDRRTNDSVGRSVLADILGSVVLGRFETFGRQYAAGPISGRWLTDARATVLQLQVGATPIARLIDSNRDGRVDNVVFAR